MFQRHHKRKNKEAGQGLVEYALILVLVAIATIIALTVMGDRFSSMFEYIFLSVEYTGSSATIEHCLEDQGEAAMTALENQLDTDIPAYLAEVENLHTAESISTACRNRLRDFAG